MKLTRLKIFRVISVSLLSVLLLFSLSAFTVLYFFPESRLLARLTTMARQATGRLITISHLKYGIRGVYLGRVVIHDGLSEKDPVILTADEVRLMFVIKSLFLEKTFKVKSVSMKNLNFIIQYDDKGVSNIERIYQSIHKGDGSAGPGASIESIRFTNAGISLRNAPKVLKPLEGDYSITGEISLNQDKSLHLSNCSIKMPENRGRLWPELSLTMNNGDFKIFGDVKLADASLRWVYMWGDNLTLPYDVVNGNVFDLEITKNHVSGRAVALSTLNNSTGTVSADGRCHVSISGNTVLLSEVKGALNGSTFLLQKLLFSFKGDIIQFIVKDMDVRVEHVRPLLDFLPDKLTGKVAGSISFQKGLYNADMDLLGVSFDQKSKFITDLTTSITVRNNIFRKKDIPLKFMDYPCSVSIASTDPNFKKLFVDVSAESIVFDEKKIPSGTSREEVNVPVEITGRVSIGELKADSFAMKKINVSYSILKDTVSFHRITGEFTGGSIMGKGSIDLGQNPPGASVSFQFSDIKIQNLDIVKEKFNERLFGLVHGKAMLNFSLNRDISKSLNGRVELQIDRGKLVDTGIQNGLGIFLSELKYKLNNLEFNAIYGNLTFEGESIKANSIIFNSDNVRLKIEGDFNRDLIARPLMINLEFNRHFIQDLPGPIALGLSKYQTGSWYVIPFSCTGDITESKNIKRLR